MTASLVVMVLGGYGIFGQRICRKLANEPAIKIVVAGRTIGKAQVLCDELRSDYPGVNVEPMSVNVPESLAAAITETSTELIIHTCGPFQGQDYAVPEICIANGVDYIDIADGRDYVGDICALDDQAVAAGVSIISGASSVPGLSSTVINALSRDMQTIDDIDFGISPGNQTPRGRAVMSAILSYVGKPISVWQQGRWQTVYGWQSLKRRKFAMAGLDTLGYRWLSICDVPDHPLFATHYPTAQNIVFRAGLQLSLLHVGLWLLSWLPRFGVVNNLARWTPLFEWGAERVKSWGSTLGGMYVDVSGRDHHGNAISRHWMIIADSGHGPYIPCLPAVALARRRARGEALPIGAFPCLGLFSLDDFAAELDGLDIQFASSSSR